MDLSKYSDAELERLANPPIANVTPVSPNLSQFSDADLERIAGTNIPTAEEALNTGGKALQSAAFGIPAGVAQIQDVMSFPERKVRGAFRDAVDAGVSALGGQIPRRGFDPSIDNLSGFEKRVTAPYVSNPQAYDFGAAIIPTALSSFLTPGTGAAKMALEGFLGGATASVGNQIQNKDSVDPVEAAIEGGIGAGTSLGTHGLFKGASAVKNRFLGPEGRSIPTGNLNTPQNTTAPLPTIPDAHLTNDPALAQDYALYQASHAGRPVPLQPPVINHPEPPSLPVEDPIEGEWRHETSRYGNDRLKDFIHIDDLIKTIGDRAGIDPQAIRAAYDSLFNAYAKHKYDDVAKKDFASRLLGQVGAKKVSINGAKIAETSKLVIPKRFQDAIDRVRHELAGETEIKRTQHLRGLVDQHFGTNPTDHPLITSAIPKDENEAAAQLAQLHWQHAGNKKSNIQGSEQIYKSLKKGYEPMLRQVEKAYREVTKDPFAQLQVFGEVAHPDKRIQGTVKVGIETVHQTRALKLVGDALKEADRLTQQIKDSIPNKRYTKDLGIDFRKYKPALALAPAALLAHGSDAQAADGHPGSKHNLAAEEAFIASVVGLTALATPQGRKLISHSLALSASFFRDSLDHIQILDNMLAPIYKAKNQTPNKLLSQILAHSGDSLHKNFGVEFPSQNDKALGAQLLSNGSVKLNQILDPNSPTGIPAEPTGTVFDTFNLQQRQALAAYDVNRRLLLGKVSAKIQEVKDLVNGGKLKDTATLQEIVRVMQHMEGALGKGVSQPGSILDRVIRSGLANTMSYLFGKWNLGHHLLNCVDHLIIGPSYVGPFNLLKAQARLASPRANKLFENHNMVGGFSAERSAAKAGIAAVNPKGTGHKSDFQWESDAFNGRIMSDAGAMHFFNMNRNICKPFANDDIDFANKLFEGEIHKASPELGMQAMSHITLINSRSLGIDPYRLNASLIGRSAAGPYISAFTNQLSRQAMAFKRNLQSGNISGMLAMMGYTALLGGHAAIPKDLGAIWQNVNPDSYFAACVTLDKANLLANVTGTEISNKLDYSAIGYPTMGSQGNPFIENARKIQEHAETLHGALNELSDLPGESIWKVLSDPKYAKKADKIYKAVLAVWGDIGSTVAPQVGGIDSKAIGAFGQSLRAMKNGKYIVNHYEGDKKIAKPDEIPLDKSGVSPAELTIRKTFGLGRPRLDNALEMATIEKKSRPGVPEAQLHYQRAKILDNARKGIDPLKGLRGLL